MSFKEYKKKKIATDATLRAEYFRLSRKRSLTYLIAKQIKEERVKRNLTQKGLAERVGTHQSGIARLENGSDLPSMSFLFAVIEALECEASFLILPRQASKNELIVQKERKKLSGRKETFSPVSFSMEELSSVAGNEESGVKRLITPDSKQVNSR